MATTDQQDSIPLTSQDAVALQGAVTAEAIASVAYTKRTKSFRVGNAEGGVLIGAGIAIGAAVLGKLLTLPFRRGNRQPKQLLTTAHAQELQTEEAKGTPTQLGQATVELRPFGSPVPDLKNKEPATATTPKLDLKVMREKAAIQDVLEAPLAAPRGARSADAMQDAREDKDQRSSNATSSSPTPPSALLPEGVPLSTFLPSADPTVLAAQLKQVQELQAEVERLRAFTSQHLVNSEKVKALEAENNTLKTVKNTLQGELNAIKSRALVSDGEGLLLLKQVVSRIPGGARSVCSDTEHLAKDTSSVDGSGAADASRRRAAANSVLQSLFGSLLAPRSPATSIPTTPRGGRVGAPATPRGTAKPATAEARVSQGSAALDLLNKFGGGFMV